MCTTSVFDDDTIERISFRLIKPLGELLHTAGDAGLVLVKARITLVTRAEELNKMVEALDGVSATELVARVRWFEEATRSRRAPLVEVRVEPFQWSPLRRRQLTFDRKELKESAILATLTRLAMLYGDDRVLIPTLQGGRSLREQGTWTPWSGAWPPSMPSVNGQQPPWPGRLPGAVPSLVYRHPREIQLFDATGCTVEVYGDGIVTSEPTSIAIGGERLAVLSFFGPWVVVERWWERRRRRYVRLMVMTSQGIKLVVRESQRWWLEGVFA
jgi:protein ImuB